MKVKKNLVFEVTLAVNTCLPLWVALRLPIGAGERQLGTDVQKHLLRNCAVPFQLIPLTQLPKISHFVIYLFQIPRSD